MLQCSGESLLYRREVWSRYNSSRVLELKKVPVKKKEEEKRYDENGGGTK
jgi:hypothetical protein